MTNVQPKPLITAFAEAASRVSFKLDKDLGGRVNIANANVTPMMAQYTAIKDGYKDALLFYRMGDFYEMFFDDAVLAAEALDIALTKRGKHLGQDIPMCGVPVHAAENYLLSLIKKGFRVAVCEQLEPPSEAKKRGAKSVVKRDVVRLVTPGTLTEESLLDARKNNYLAAYSIVRDEGAFAWVDVSTGAFFVQTCANAALSPQLARLSPREVLVSDSFAQEFRPLIEESGAAMTPLARASFDSDGAKKRLCQLYSVKSLDGFGQFGRAELSALGAIVEYLDLTQKGKLPLLKPPVLEANSRIMQIDAATRRNLELTQSLSGTRNGSLLSVIDRTITGAGARLLANRIQSPSTHLKTIQSRLLAIDTYLETPVLAENTRSELRKSPDIDRALSRLSLDRGGPRDITAIREGARQAAIIEGLHQEVGNHIRRSLSLGSLTGFESLTDLLDRAIIAEPPLLARDGGFVKTGFDAELDEMRTLRDQGRSVIAKMQKSYMKSTGVNALKIKHNNVLGYFVETPSSHADKMLAPPFATDFKHRQTTANAIRFTTPELAQMETKILNAGGRATAIELRIFQEMRAEIINNAGELGLAAATLARIDLAAALADLAIGENWCRPVLTNDRAFEITDGRHPVVEHALRRGSGDPFVANCCDLTPYSDNAASIWLLTGPNMAGKSTFLRQNAIIALLAQMGSYVPARSAQIGIVTQLFSRVGASDDLARGRSTFMVEMVETAAILNQAEPGALVILDEVGRGTATYDGLSIAWATLEHLHEKNKSRTLFATHYHELTSLSSSLVGLTNTTVSVREWQGEVIFLHEVRKGVADRSYGVQVAQLAGLPPSVVARARVVLEALEKSDQEGQGKSASLGDDLPLFSLNAQAPIAKNEPSKVEEALKSAHPDDLSPLEALKLVYELRDLLRPDKA